MYKHPVQGLSDPEETVVCKALEAITVFCEQHLFDHQRLLEVFTESIPFLCHPVSLLMCLCISVSVFLSMYVDVDAYACVYICISPCVL